jgi:bifunctional non-homologous end joining protein LigD
LPLNTYREKRNVDRTPEPFGTVQVDDDPSRSGLFVVQKHAARRLHYDFRLQMQGVLRSWAVPKGPSLDPSLRRLAVMVEDHPVEYGDFEGVIPQGNYGAGVVIVWDRGQYSVLEPVHGTAAEAVRQGKLDIELRGFKLRGAFTLVRTRRDSSTSHDAKEQWLLIKKRDEYADDTDVLQTHPRSVLSGLTIEEMRAAAQFGSSAEKLLSESGAPPLTCPLEADSFPLNLAKTSDQPFDSEDWLFELKYDGVRTLAIRDGDRVVLFGRNRHEITHRYPEVVLALSKLPIDRFVVDGEIVVPDNEGRPSFQLLQRRMHCDDTRQIRHLSLSMPVIFWAFDLLACGNHDVRQLPLDYRKHVLAQMIRGEGPVRYCDHVIGRGREFFALAAQARLEGVVAKRRAAPYQGTRTGDWLKIKCPLFQQFVIGGWTEPSGTRIHFGALLIGQYEESGELRFVARVGTGFDENTLRELFRLLNERKRATSPFRRPRPGEASPPPNSHFCEPELVCTVRFSEWTADGGIRHPVFEGLAHGVPSRSCVYAGGERAANPAKGIRPDEASHLKIDPGNRQTRPVKKTGVKPVTATSGLLSKPGNGCGPVPERQFKATNLDKVFWPEQGYTKGDLLEYYWSVARWMLPYLKQRPVVLTRYPDGINGKSFFQKDAPQFAPRWVRTEKIYSPDSQRDIAYFVLESPEAIVYVANMGSIPIHIWSSHFPHLERPDWLLFDIDPKLSTTEQAVIVARAVGDVLREIGLRPYVKTSGQKGIHVVVGLEPRYTYEQARMFAELVARVTLRRVPESATLIREHAARKGRAYIDYMQLGYGKTIAAPFAVRPVSGAPVSTPLQWDELQPTLDPLEFNIKTVPLRMERLKADPFLGAINDPQRLEDALPKLEELVRDSEKP